MTEILLLAAAALVALLVVGLARVISRDGLGSRRPPSSHSPWSDSAQNLPSRPY